MNRTQPSASRISDGKAMPGPKTLAPRAEQVRLQQDHFVVGDSNGRMAKKTAAEVRASLSVENGATADQTGAEIKALYEAEANTNAYTDSEKAKLGSIDATHYGAPVQDTTALTALLEANLTDKERRYVEDEISDYFYDSAAVSGDLAPDDQTGGTGFWRKVSAGGDSAASIKTKYESNADTNAFTDAEQTKVANALVAADIADFETSAELDSRDTANRSTDNHTNGSTNKVFTATEQTKLAGIETNADVTDATNVATAGAVMVSNLDTPNNPPSLDSNGNLQARLLVTKDVEATIDATVWEDGEIVVVEDGGGTPIDIRVGDAVTAGGVSLSGSGVSDGNKGEITVASGVWTLNAGVVDTAELAAAAVEAANIADNNVTVGKLDTTNTPGASENGYAVTYDHATGQMTWAAAGGGSGDLLSTNNLSDVASAATAATNLGLGTTSEPQFQGLGIGEAVGSSALYVRVSSSDGSGAGVSTNTVGVKLSAVNVVMEQGWNSSSYYYMQAKHFTTGAGWDFAINPNGGEVGIGTQPSAGFHVKSSSTPSMKLERAGTSNASIQFITTTGDVYFGQYTSGNFVVGQSSNLATSQMVEWTSAGEMTVYGSMKLKEYTFATLPTASLNTAKTIQISDRSHRLATSDGTNWNWAGTTTTVS